MMTFNSPCPFPLNQSRKTLIPNTATPTSTQSLQDCPYPGISLWPSPSQQLVFPEGLDFAWSWRRGKVTDGYSQRGYSLKGSRVTDTKATRQTRTNPSPAPISCTSLDKCPWGSLLYETRTLTLLWGLGWRGLMFTKHLIIVHLEIIAFFVMKDTSDSKKPWHWCDRWSESPQRKGKEAQIGGASWRSRYLTCVCQYVHHSGKWGNPSLEGEILKIRSAEGEGRKLWMCLRTGE